MRNYIVFFVGLIYFGNQVHIAKYQDISFENGEIWKLPRHIIINTVFPEKLTEIYRYYVSKKENRKGIPIKIEFI